MRTNGTQAIGARRSVVAQRQKPSSRHFLIVFLRRPSSLLGTVVLLLIGIMGVFGPSLAPHGQQDTDIEARLQGHSAKHWLGTDQFGRDVLSRLLYGARYTIWIGLSSVVVSCVIGTAIGLVGGYFGGWVDEVTGRVMDILLTFPAIFLGLAVVTILGAGMSNAIFAVGVVGIPRFSRMARSSVLSVKERDFVEAAKAIGASHTRILIRHILPNSAGPLIVFATLWSASAIIFASGLSFLGIGVQPPIPEWGAILADAQPLLLIRPMLSVYPGLMISIFVLGLNLIGDGLRDYLDPRTRSEKSLW